MASNHLTTESLESRTLLAFTPLPAAPLVVAESASSITPFSTVVAKFQGNAGDFYLGTIDWGDGNVDSTSFAFADPSDPSGKTFDVYSSTGHAYSEEGLYNIKAGVSDLTTGNPADGGVTTNQAFVADAPLSGTATPIVGTEGVSQTFTVATFTDPDTGPPGGPNPNAATDYLATIDWGDGSAITTATIVSNGGGSYSVRGAHTYADEIALSANIKATVVITDTDGENPPQGTRASITLNPTVQVNDAAISLAAPNPPPATFVEGATSAGVIAVLTDLNTNAPASDFAAPGGSVTINWGDGSPTTAGFLQPLGGGKFNVFGFHAYAEEGNKTVTVTAVDKGGAAPASVTYTLSVKDAPFSVTPQAVSGVEGATTTTIVAMINDTNPGPIPTGDPGDFSGTINWGDGSGTVAFTSGSVALVSQTTTSATYKVTLSHTFLEEGVFTGSMTVNDVGGAPAQTVSFTSTVTDAPLSANTTQPTISGTEGLALTGANVANFTDADPNGNPAVDYKATIDWGDGSAIDTTSATFTKDGSGVIHVLGSHTYKEEGNYRAIVTVTDTDGGVTTVVPRASVAVSNPVSIADAPLVLGPNSPATIGAVEGQPLSQTIIAKFTDTDPFELEAGDIANNEYTVSVNWGDGTAVDNSAVIVQTGGPGSVYNILGSNHIYPNEGTFTVLITVKDNGGAPPLVINTTATVAEAPLVPTTPPAPAITVPEGQTYTGVVASFINSDPFEPPAEQVYTLVSIDWGDGNVTGGSIVPNGFGGFNVLGSHAYTEENITGYTISVKVKESVEPDSAASTITNKAIVPDAAITVTPLTVAATEGLALTNATVATFTDGDLLNTAPGDYAVTINWGDGSPTTAGTAVFDGPGLWHVIGSHTYAEEGVYAPNPFTGTGGIKVTVIDTDGGPTNAPNRASGSATSTAIVGDAPLTPIGVSITTNLLVNGVNPITEGAPFQAVVAKFSDANPIPDTGDFSATISWGDGSPTSQGVISQPGGAGTPYFVTSPIHTYNEDGVFSVTVFVGDVGGSTTVVNSTATVADAALSNTPAGPVANPLVGSEGASYSGPIATLTDADPNAVPGDYSGTITWGDGGTSAATFTQIGVGKFIVSGNHLYAEDGLYTIAYTITDSDGHLVSTPAVPRSTTSGSSAIQVLDAPLFNLGVANPPAATEGVSTGTITVAKFLDSDPGGQVGDYIASINWGDGTAATTGTIGGTALAGFTVTGSHVYTEEKASYTITVTITDDDHHIAPPAVPRSTLTTTTAIAVNDAPLTGSNVAPITATEGLALTGVTVANFTDADTTNTSAGDYVASINWGDGTASNGVVSQTGVGAWTVKGSHTYTEEGSYPIVVTITDTDGQNPPVGLRATTSASTTANVADAALVDRTPVQTLAGTEGASFTGTVAQFTDNDPGGNIGDYIATINWGDGSPLQTGVTAVLLTNGNFGINGTHVYAEEGLKTVTVQIWDTDGGPTTGRVNIITSNTKVNVADAAISIVSTPFSLPGAPEGFSTSNVPLAVFKDANAAAPVTDFLPVSAGGEGGSVVVNWGDGTAPQTLPASAIQSAGSGFFIVRGTHTYGEDGVYQVDVTVTDAGGAPPVSLSTSTGKDTITVPDAPLSPLAPNGNPQNIIATQNVPLSSKLLGTFVDADPGAQVGDYTATINWGDGSPPDTTTATFSPGLAPGSFNVFGTHTFTTFGVFGVTVTITDSDQHLGTTPPVTRATTTLTGTVITVNAAAAQQPVTPQFLTLTSSSTSTSTAASNSSSQSVSKGALVDHVLPTLVAQPLPTSSKTTGVTVSLKKNPLLS